ncbi:MAG: protein-disulfide reductase DsbD domain-containing protein [Phycisphaerales bacterium JB038]
MISASHTPDTSRRAARPNARRLLVSLVGTLGILLGGTSAAAPYPPTKPTSPLLKPEKKAQVQPVEARIFTGYSAIRPGMELQVAVQFEIKPGWRIYWQNAGDLPAGATQVKLQAPVGFTVGPPLWSGPKARRTAAGLVQYIYDRQALVVFPVKTPEEWAAGDEIELQAEYEWTAENQTTVRGKGTLELVLPLLGVDEPLEESADLTELLNLLAELPADAEELEFEIVHTWSGPELLISAPDAELLTFFPHASTEWTLENAGECIEGREQHLRAKIRDLRAGSRKPITGVIAVGKRVKRRVDWTYFSFKAERLATDM